MNSFPKTIFVTSWKIENYASAKNNYSPLVRRRQAT